MMQSTKESLPYPTVLGTLKAGFDVTTRHWWLVILPFMLDVFLWLGPRLSYQTLGQGYLDFWLSQVGDSPLVQPDQIDVFSEFLARSNLLNTLTGLMVGIPSFFGNPVMLGGFSPAETPVDMTVITLSSWTDLGVNWVLLMLVSLLLSATYFSLVVQAIGSGEIDWTGFGRNIFTNTLRLLMLVVIFFIVLLIVLIPLTLVATVAGLINQSLSFVVLAGGTVVIMWGVVLFSFSTQALFLDQAPPLRAMQHSVFFIQRHINAVLPLLLAIVLINNLTDTLWVAAYDASWLSLISVAGHAFIATALVVATFIFYRDQIAARTEAALSQ